MTNLDMPFQAFPKIARLSREIVVTEKIDGTNACIYIGENGEFLVGKRTAWITPENDNYGFATWAYENKEELLKLGVGRHYGEWWGEGIQRRYGIKGKRFSLFNVHKWSDNSIRPACCHVVPVLYKGDFDTDAIRGVLHRLILNGSEASPGFMIPEGVIIYHTHAKTYFKKTIDGDEKGKEYGA